MNLHTRLQSELARLWDCYEMNDDQYTIVLRYMNYCMLPQSFCEIKSKRRPDPGAEIYGYLLRKSDVESAQKHFKPAEPFLKFCRAVNDCTREILTMQLESTERQIENAERKLESTLF